MNQKIQKKRFVMILLLAVTMTFVMVSASAAQGPDGSGWWTSPSVQNVSTGNATIVFTAYHNTDSTNTSTYSGSAVLAPNSSVIYHPGLAANCAAAPTVAANGCRLGVSPSLPSGFDGSVVISSDAPVVSFVSLKNNPGGTVGVTGGLARASYEGISGDAAASLLYFPSFKNNFAGQSAIFYVQAAGADSTVRMTYTSQETTPTVYTEEKTILANRTYAFIPSAAGVPSCNGSTGNNCRGGAVLEVLSGGNVAGTAVEYEDGASVAQFVLASGAITPANTDTTILIPSAKDNFNNQTTGIAILNTTGTAATVDLTFNVKGVKTLSGTCSVNVGDVETGTVSVPANGTTVVRTTAGNTPFPSNCGVFYSVTIEDQGADQALAATVNQSGSNQFTKYNGFAASTATNTVLFPLVKESFVGGETGVSLVNAGSVATTVTVTYSSASDHVMKTVSVDPGESITLRQVALGDSDIASVISGGLPTSSDKYAVTAVADAAGALIVGFAQESGGGLDIQNYGGTNQ